MKAETIRVASIRISPDFYIEFLNPTLAIICDNDGDDVGCRFQGQQAALLHRLALSPNEYVKKADVFEYVDNLCKTKVGLDDSGLSKLKSNPSKGNGIIQKIKNTLGWDISKENPSYIRIETDSDGAGTVLHVSPDYIVKIATSETESDNVSAYFSSPRIRPLSGTSFIARPEIIERIQHAFELTNEYERIIFLTGIGGIGKSEIARRFAQEAIDSKVFKNSIELYYIAEPSAFDTAIKRCSNIIIKRASDERNELQEKKKLLNQADESLLVIVHSFDILDQYGLDFLNAIFNSLGTARVLITSRIGMDPVLGEYGQIISFDEFHSSQLQFASDVFCKYANITSLSPDMYVVVEKIMRYIGGHTMMAGMLGRHIYRNESPEMLLNAMEESVRKALQESGIIKITKDGTFVEPSNEAANPYNILKVLFADILKMKFTERERQVLGAMLIVPWAYYDARVEIVAALVGDLPENRKCREARRAINRLIDSGLVQLNEEDNILYLHPLICQLISDRDLGENGAPIAEQTSDYIFHLLNNAFVSTEQTPRSNWADLKFLITRLSRHCKDLFANASDYNCGWSMLWHWTHTLTIDELIKGKYYDEDKVYFQGIKCVLLKKAINYNHSILGLEAICDKEVYDLFGNHIGKHNHRSLFFTIEHKKGKSLWIYDCTEKKEWCVINCSEQLLLTNRYYNKQPNEQKGDAIEAVFAGFVDSPPDFVIVPATIKGLPVTSVDGDLSESPSLLCLPNTIQYIGNQAFSYAYDLQVVVILSKSVRVDDCAFLCCENLEFIFIPSSPGISIGEAAFKGCDKLTSMTLTEGMRVDVVLSYSAKLAFLSLFDENGFYTQTSESGEQVQFGMKEVRQAWLNMNTNTMFDDDSDDDTVWDIMGKTKMDVERLFFDLLEIKEKMEQQDKGLENRYPMCVGMEYLIDTEQNTGTIDFDLLYKQHPELRKGSKKDLTISTPFPHELALYMSKKDAPENISAVYLTNVLLDTSSQQISKGEYDDARALLTVAKLIMLCDPDGFQYPLQDGKITNVYNTLLMKLAVSLVRCLNYAEAYEAITIVDNGKISDRSAYHFYMGFILGRLERHDEALQYKLKSLALSLDYYKKALDNHKDDTRDIISCLVDISCDYNSLGQTYCALGDYDTSLEYLEKSLKIRSKYIPSNGHAFAESYESFGDTYLAIATPESLLQAEEYYSKTRRIFVEEYGSEDREDVRRLDEKLSQCREQIDINQQL